MDVIDKQLEEGGPERVRLMRRQVRTYQGEDESQNTQRHDEELHVCVFVEFILRSACKEGRVVQRGKTSGTVVV